jgi:predicted MFS family arabinose efflux permease
VLVLSDAVRALAFLAMLLPGPTWLLLVLLGAAGLAAPPFAAARAALVPDVVAADKYPDAIALTQLTDQTTIVLGYAAGGALIAAFGAPVCLLLNASSFVVSAALVFRVRTMSGSNAVRSRRCLALAIRSILCDRPIRLAVLLTCGTSGCAMAAEALVVPLARVQGGGGVTTTAFAVSVPLGTVVATTLLTRSTDAHVNLRRAALLALFGGAAGMSAFFAASALWATGLGLAAAGAVFGVAAPTNAVIGPRLPAHLRSSAFGVLIGCLMGSQALGAVAGGLVADTLGPRTSCALFLGLAAVTACACLASISMGAPRTARVRGLSARIAHRSHLARIP